MSRPTETRTAKWWNRLTERLRSNMGFIQTLGDALNVVHVMTEEGHRDNGYIEATCDQVEHVLYLLGRTDLVSDEHAEELRRRLNLPEKNPEEEADGEEEEETMPLPGFPT